MNRKEVYKAIDTEREYQNTVRVHNEGDWLDDREKAIPYFIIYMENKLQEAKDCIYRLDEEAAMDSIRKVAGLAVAAGEVFGMKKRDK